jgi:hypothetical protein
MGLAPATTGPTILTVMGMTQRLQRHAGILATTAALGTLVVACGDDADTSTTAAPSFVVPSPDDAPYFSEPFDDDSNGWGTLDDPDYGTAGYEGGDYVWRLRGRIGHVVPTTLGEPVDAGELTLADVVVHATGTIESGDGVAGVFCRETPDTDAEFQWYEFVVRDGYAAIRLSDMESNIEVLAEDEQLDLPAGEDFQITGACVGDTLSLAVNGTPVLQAHDDRLSDGVPGVEAFTYPVHAQLDLRWHDFSVSKA